MGKKKQAVSKKTVNNNSAKQKDAETLKREGRKPLEAYMRDNGIWQIDLFNLITDEYEIYSVEEFEQLKSDKDMVDEFLEQAKHCGVMGKQAITLSVFCGKKKKKKKKKDEKVAKPKESKPRQKDHSELKIEARPKLEKYLRDNEVWQIDLFDLMTDQYNIYSVEDFLEYKDDEDWIDEFLEEVKYLQKMLGRRKTVNKKKKQKEIKKSVAPKKKELSPQEIENKARDKMEPFMQKEGFWHKDLFLILLEYEVYVPDDLNNLSKSDRKEIFQEAKQKGLMGKVKKFKAYFS